MIASAAGQAREQIKAHADQYISASLRHFAIRLGLKAVGFGIVLAVLALSPVPDGAALIVVAVVLGAYLVWDAVVTWPTLRIVTARLWSAGFQPRRALGEAVAAHVFAQVLSQAEDVSRSQTLLLAAAGTSASRYKTDIAKAVSTLAADASWDDLKPFLLLASVKVVTVLGLYALYTWIMLQIIL